MPRRDTTSTELSAAPSVDVDSLRRLLATLPPPVPLPPAFTFTLRWSAPVVRSEAFVMLSPVLESRDDGGRPDR